MPNWNSIERTCAECGKTMYVQPARLKDGKGRYCSMKCRNMNRKAPVEKRFWSRVRKTDSCWEWTGRSRHTNGYGMISINHVNVGAHRISWEIHYGPIPDGLFVCHKCDNPLCVRPDHLFLGTTYDNNLDALIKGRMQIGEKHGMAKLTESQVREIKALYAECSTTITDIAARYGVVRSTVQFIVSGHTWKHVD